MLRASLLLALAAPSLAQSTVSAVRNPTPLRSAGIYHVATGTWSRTGATANLGPDVIYAATAPSGYFGTGFEEQAGVNEGILPGTTNPLGGPQDCYRVDGFTFGYCSQDSSSDWSFRFYDSYRPCDVPSAPDKCLHQASGTIEVTGVPGAGACWVVTVDLTGGAEFDMVADGGPCHPGYQGGPDEQDHFGYSLTYASASGALTGPLLSGYDPNWAPAGEGTCYLPSLTCPAGATGLGARDFFMLDDGAAYTGCHWFGGYNNTNGCGGPSQGPGAQFHLEMFTDCSNGGTCVVGDTVCDDPAQLGELTLDTPILTQDPTLTASGLAGGQFAMLLVAATAQGAASPPGAQGSVLCLDAPVGRYVSDVVALGGGDAYSLDLEDTLTGGPGFGLPGPPGGAIQAGETWAFQNWTRLGPGASRFSRGLRVQFTD